MYKLYEQFCAEKMVKPEKISFYRYIFTTEFNLSFHRPNTDTCDKCDRLKITIDHGTPEQKRQAEIEKELHLQ